MRRSQQDRSRGTKAALTAAARALFAARGYDAVPADEIVRAAGVTRGALYHHYADKKALFRDVVVGLEAEITAEIRTAMTSAPDLPTGIAAALTAFLDACARPEVRQVSLLDAPRVLGWSDWRAIEAEFGLALLIEAFTLATDAGLVRPQPVGVLSRLILSALTEAALLIADADDPAQIRAQAEQALGTWIAGLIG
ncbi:TetR/AcrR family transcriptional regulator [Actinokineospora iranica]|uniref:DNA-binding transcriptional regulator, AcrR family n=1 Tax=Actinokineospora iranica TaxID=1271860 RepID=A0A1G6U3T4_9PSEU|nr:TetR/AcrR family transcriptional regulator [Actinokineospora iranica]SDD35941.1 DNA-binding transcriptional regulator, AcrR family [Actinokineospora iranica]